MTRWEGAGLAFLGAAIVAVLVSLVVVNTNIRQTARICHQNGYPEVIRSDAGTFCLKREDGTDRMVPVKGLR